MYSVVWLNLNIFKEMNYQLLILFIANALMLLFVFTGKGRKLSRLEGLLLTLGYVAFMILSI